MSALLNPKSLKMLVIPIITITSAIMPKSVGSNVRVRIIDVINPIICLMVFPEKSQKNAFIPFDSIFCNDFTLG